MSSLKKLFVKLPILILIPICFILKFHNLAAEDKGKKAVLFSKIVFYSKEKSNLNELFLDKMKQVILEKFSHDYTVLTESDLEHLIDQAEEIQKHGKDATKILSQISDARESDEFVTGKIFYENQRIRILLNNISNNKVSGILSTKSIVDVAFYESDLEHYISESAIKILYPKYTILTSDQKKNFVKSEFNQKKSAEPVQISDLIWGDFEGLQKWEQASALCLQKGMRLPTPDELRKMSLAKHRSLIEPCCVYWTSLENRVDEDYAFYLDINDGYGSYYHKELDVRVRCVKKNR
jgi:hypothetical protein